MLSIQDTLLFAVTIGLYCTGKSVTVDIGHHLSKEMPPWTPSFKFLMSHAQVQ
jgi:hypothetical protein